MQTKAAIVAASSAHRDGQGAAPAAAGAAPLRRAGLRVLIADDQSAIRLLCRISLEDAGISVSEVGDGPSTIVAAREQQPDVILLDGMLPGLDGWAVAAALHADPGTAQIPIIFFSARAASELAARAAALGAIGYLTKPFNPATLADAIKQLLAAAETAKRDPHHA
jgi:CheY-like chemotaxis protein